MSFTNLFFLVLCSVFFMNFCGKKTQEESSTNDLVEENGKNLNNDIFVVEKIADLPECTESLKSQGYYIRDGNILQVCSSDKRYITIKGDPGLKGEPGLEGEQGSLEKSINSLPKPTFSTIPVGLDLILSMDSLGNSQIFYTTDESDPTINSGVYGPGGLSLECCDDKIYKAFQTHSFFANSDIATFTVSFLYQFGFKFGSRGTGDGEFDRPHGVAIDSSGNIYVIDSSRGNLQKFNSTGKFFSIIEGLGAFESPRGIAIDSNDNIYVVDASRQDVQIFSSTGEVINIFGSEEEEDEYFRYPIGIALDQEKNVYILDADKKNVQKFTQDGTPILEFGEEGTGEGQFVDPIGIALSAEGYLYVVDATRDDVQKFNLDGSYEAKFGSHGEGDQQFGDPRGIAISAEGYLYVVDGDRDDVQKFDSDGNFISKFGSYGQGKGEFRGPRGIAINSEGHIYIADATRDDVQKILPINQ